MSRALVVWLVLASANVASAYPHFQRTSGSVRCNQCHLAPAGGGLLTPWGAEESSDAIGRGGDGRFLHGLVTLPAALILGGDLRLAALANSTGGTQGAELAAFPMQLDFSVAVRSGAWTVVGIIGARGRVRSGTPNSEQSTASEVPDTSLASYVISREHYVMWRPDESAGIYVNCAELRLT